MVRDVHVLGLLGPPVERLELGYQLFLWSSLVGEPSPKKRCERALLGDLGWRKEKSKGKRASFWGTILRHRWAGCSEGPCLCSVQQEPNSDDRIEELVGLKETQRKTLADVGFYRMVWLLLPERRQNMAEPPKWSRGIGWGAAQVLDFHRT